MTTWVVLLRGVNVGGNNRLPMADLREALADAGFANPRTYIQSGNIVFDTGDVDEVDAGSVAAQVRAVVADRFGFSPSTWAMPLHKLEAAAAANPFPQADTDPKLVHLYFLDREPNDAAIGDLRELAVPGEQVVVAGCVAYLFTPHGMARCKMAEKLDRTLGVDSTARNWRTVTALRKLAGNPQN